MDYDNNGLIRFMSIEAENMSIYQRNENGTISSVCDIGC